LRKSAQRSAAARRYRRKILNFLVSAVARFCALSGIVLSGDVLAGTSHARKIMKRAFIVIGILATLIGISIILPALANYGHPGAMASNALRAVVAGSLITVAGASVTIFGFRKRFV
jgi:asparagine N-glycosylation enzyme membrane subunit Stt3